MFNLLHEIGKAASLLLGLPKSLALNFRYLPPHQAMMLPILVSHRVKLRRLNGSVELGTIKTGMVQIGLGGLGQNSGNGDSVWAVNGHIRFAGKTRIGCGAQLLIDGSLKLGENFEASKNLLILCHDQIEIGDHTLLSWQVTLMDTDSHEITRNGSPLQMTAPIMIGKHVWVGCEAMLLKGSQIGDDSVVAARSLVTAGQHESGTLMAGSPAKAIKQDVGWR